MSPRCPDRGLVTAGVVGLRAPMQHYPPQLTLPGLLYLRVLSEQHSLPGGAESRKLRLRKLGRTRAGAPGTLGSAAPPHVRACGRRPAPELRGAAGALVPPSARPPRGLPAWPLALCLAGALWRFHGELSFGGPWVGLSIWVET